MFIVWCNFSGDRKYKIPPLDPVELEEVRIIDEERRAQGLSLILKHVKIYGVKDTKMEKAE
jgi:hypothetical protein